MADLTIRSVAPDEWEEVIGREIEQLSRAPFFVLHPEALVAARGELQRIREGRGTDLELEEDDDVWGGAQPEPGKSRCPRSRRPSAPAPMQRSK
jgi:hypothetical protein